MPNDFKVCLAQQVLNVFLAASKEVVQANHLQHRHQAFVG